MRSRPRCDRPGAIDPALPSFEPDAIAQRLGVDVHGRYTALGDALVTAEVYVRLLPRLADLNVTTLGAAQAFAQTAKGFVQKQREARGRGERDRSA